MTTIRTIFLFLFLVFLQTAAADETEDKVITNLRELAARLGWAQDIFIGLQARDQDVKIFGIADIPFSSLHSSSEKSYIQWVLGHRLSLEKMLDRHLKNYSRSGFEVIPMEGVGDKAYRALRYSYTPKDFVTLELSQSQEIVEILSFKSLLTLRDERAKLDVDAWSIFEEVFERTKIDPFIQPMPSQMPQKLDLEARFQNFPRKVRLSQIFPTKEEGREWHVNKFTPREKRDQITALGRRYRLLEDGGSSSPIEISLYAYASPALAERAFKHYLRKIKRRFSIQYEEKDRSAFLISEKKELNADRYIFYQEIFVFDLKISAKKQKNGRALLRSFSELLRVKTKKIFPKG